MESKKITPMLPTFEALLNACVKARDVTRVNELMETIGSMSLPPVNITTIQNLLKICCYDDTVTTSTTLFEHIRRMDVAVTQGLLLEIMDSAARKERFDLSENVWQYMLTHKISPDLLAYDSLLYAYINAKVSTRTRLSFSFSC